MIEESTEPSDIGYKRILLKLSGESLMGRNGFGIDEEVLQQAGVSDFEQYAVQPGAPLQPDLFL